MFSKTIRRFADQAPICVMVRLAIEHALADEVIDQLFRNTAKRQYERELLFSSVVGLMRPVVCGSRKSVHDAYRHLDGSPAVSVASVYNKLNHVEPAVSAELVRHTARQVGPLVKRMRQDRHSPLPGYAVRIVDGGHLAGTEHRIRELRATKSAARPGQALAVRDPAARLIVDVVPREDAHARERTLVGPLLTAVRPGEVWVGDRNFCTTRMLFGLAAAAAYSLIRYHDRSLKWRELAPFRPRGRTDTGRVSEQPVAVCDPATDRWMTLRRIRLERDEPTEDGETESLRLSDLPETGPGAVSAKQIADTYRRRWSIENAFEDLTVSRRGEIDTLGYPAAARLGFCLAVVAYNLVSLVMATLGAVHGEEAREISCHQLAREWAAVYPGMIIAADPREWAAYRDVDDAAPADVLKELAGTAQPRRYLKARRGPKKKRPPRSSGTVHHHVATARLLAARQTAAAPP